MQTERLTQHTWPDAADSEDTDIRVIVNAEQDTDEFYGETKIDELSGRLFRILAVGGGSSIEIMETF